MRFSLSIVGLSIFVILCVLAGTNVLAAEPINKIAAVVNGEMITTFDLNGAIAPELLRNKLDPRNPAHHERIQGFSRQILNEMINDIIMAQEAERLKIGVSDDEVEEALRQFKQRSKLSEEEFQRQVKIQGLTQQDFKIRIRKNLLKNRLLSNMVGRKVVVTKEEVTKYYEEHKDEFMSGRYVQFSLLVYPPATDVESWAKRIQSGKISFAQVARDLSVGPNATQGGALERMPWEDLAPVLREHLSPLKAGQVSAPFPLEGLQAQVQLGEISSGSGGQDFEQVKEQIENMLRQPKLEERYQEYSEQLRKRAMINIRL